MIGLIAEVEDDQAAPDQTELSEVKWFTREEARRLIAGEYDGVRRSDDNGKTWRPIGLTGHQITDLRFDRLNANRIYACARPYSGVCQGIDNNLSPHCSVTNQGCTQEGTVKTFTFDTDGT